MKRKLQIAMRIEMTKAISILVNLQVVLLVSVITSLPYFIVLNSFLIVLTAINSIAIYAIDRERKSLSKKEMTIVFVFASLFILYFVVMVISNQYNLWFILEKKFSILIFPIIFAITHHKLTKQHLHLVLIAFVVSTLFAAAITFNGRLNLLFGIRPEDDIDSYLIFRRPYFGLYCLFSVIISGYLWSKYSNWILRGLFLLVAIFFIYFSSLIYAKMAILGFAITLFFLVVTFLWSKHQFRKLGLLLGTIMFGLAFIVLITPNLQLVIHKVLRFEPFDFSKYQWIYFLSLNMRFAIWECSWNLLNQDFNWLYGCGLDHQQLLDQCYYSSDAIWIKYGILPELQENFPYNAHNEYLHTWLDAGIFGLILLLSIILFSLRIAVKRRNFLYFSFLLFFFFCCATESMFSVQKGIVFYSFFNSFFAFNRFATKDTGQ